MHSSIQKVYSMKKKKSNKQYRGGQIRKFTDAICYKYKLDHKEVSAFLVKQFPELKKKEKCANCGASMALYEHKMDYLDALLLIGMGKIISSRLQSNIPFRRANQIHLQTTLKAYYSVPSRSTWCSKLGLITKVKHRNGRHDQKAGWLVTKRGFEFLAGKPVPARVQTFRNGITERFDDMITIGEVKYDPYSREGIELSNYKEYKFDQLENFSKIGFAQGVLL